MSLGTLDGQRTASRCATGARFKNGGTQMGRLDEIRQRVEDRQGKQFFMAEPEAFAWGAVQCLLSEVDRLSEENKEWAEIATRIASNHEASSTRLEESALGLKEKVDTLAEVAKRAIAALTARAEAAETRADAAVEDLRECDNACEFCKYFLGEKSDECCNPPKTCEYYSAWEWRGPQQAGEGATE